MEKARLINCTFNEPPLADAPQTVSWKLEGTDWTIHNHANVFSRTGLDIGARFFMQHLPENPKVRLSISAVVTALLA